MPREIEKKFEVPKENVAEVSVMLRKLFGSMPKSCASMDYYYKGPVPESTFRRRVDCLTGETILTLKVKDKDTNDNRFESEVPGIPETFIKNAEEFSKVLFGKPIGSLLKDAGSVWHLEDAEVSMVRVNSERWFVEVEGKTTSRRNELVAKLPLDKLKEEPRSLKEIFILR